jgi:hypothetical protein
MEPENITEYTDVIGHWKLDFISFEMGRSYATISSTTWAQKKTSFLTTLDVCSQNSTGHKAVKFGTNTYVHCGYDLTKNHLILWVPLWKCLFCVDLMWNDPKCIAWKIPQ